MPDREKVINIIIILVDDTSTLLVMMMELQAGMGNLFDRYRPGCLH